MLRVKGGNQSFPFPYSPFPCSFHLLCGIAKGFFWPPICYTPIFPHVQKKQEVTWCKMETMKPTPDQTRPVLSTNTVTRLEKKISCGYPLDLRIERMIAAYLWAVEFEDFVQRRKSQRRYTILNGGIKQLQLPFSFKLMDYTKPKAFHGAESLAGIFFPGMNETVDQWIWQSIAGRQLEFEI